MEIKQIGTRGVTFTDNGTSVYLIKGEHRLYLCDTHWGPKSMECVKEYIKDQQLEEKELVVFNTHSDYDHVWGNCAFGDDVTIISHEACRKRMAERGEFDIQKASPEAKQGEVELRLPNLTFDSTLAFADDEVEFIYAPGHTIGSAICYDRRESVVFVGDLLEEPVPVLLYHDLEVFIHSLGYIQSLEAETIVTTHSGVVDEALLEANLNYLQDVLKRSPVELEGEYQQLHEFNTKHLVFLKYEAVIREKLGAKFDFPTFMTEFWSSMDVDDLSQTFRNILNANPDQLEDALRGYLSKL